MREVSLSKLPSEFQYLNIVLYHSVLMIQVPHLHFTGPCLLRMTNLLLGEENFQKSISAYINKYKFSTATSDDLWDIMTSNAHASEVIPNTLSMKIIMDSWLLQAGYPALKVTIDYQTKKVLVNQVLKINF